MDCIETIFELVRVANRDFGFLVEIARSDFPIEGISMPDLPWWGRRIEVNTRNIWMPQGGKEKGTVLISNARVGTGAPIPTGIMRFIANQLANSILSNIRKGADLAVTPGSRWHDRVKKDLDGFYKDLAAVEAAAAKRRPISVTNLPGPEVFDRPTKLA
mmetsp:Transcript_57571/g.186985  ORF Transcript_57571/g.186985 Transcript_57571/m.186985 type:complete len:159 (+) Transcript_57571:95-571(+)